MTGEHTLGKVQLDWTGDASRMRYRTLGPETNLQMRIAVVHGAGFHVVLGLARHDRVEMPHSNLKRHVADVLKSEGYLDDVRERELEIAADSVALAEARLRARRSKAWPEADRLRAAGAVSGERGCRDAGVIGTPRVPSSWAVASALAE